MTNTGKSFSMADKPRLAILLATYNGGRYIREQLDSLYAQTYSDWNLYVRDDGSSDETLDIVNEYTLRYGNVFVERNAHSLGALNNFMKLLETVDADYYMFCDQDDVWLPNKVELTLRNMLEAENRKRDVPVTVFTDLKVVDENLRVTGESYWYITKIDTENLLKKEYMYVHFFATGCAMMINRKVKLVAFPYPPTAMMHDAWVLLKTVVNGGVVRPVAVPTILYRQHGKNVVGAENLREGHLRRRMSNLVAVWNDNKRMYAFARNFGCGSVLEYIWYKCKYDFLIRRKSLAKKQ